MLRKNEDKKCVDRTRNPAIPIPIKSGRKYPGRDFSSSSGSSSGTSGSSISPGNDDSPQLSHSYRGGLQSSSIQSMPLNVYGTSPRTSVMFNYYNSPKGSYGRQKLIRTKSTDTPQAGWHTSGNNLSNQNFATVRLDTSLDRDRSRDSLEPSSRHGVSPAISGQHFVHLDTRPRAWSESDKHHSTNPSSLQNSRMSALRRLRMKFGQKGVQKRQRSCDDERNQSAASIASLEKVEEGCQLHAGGSQQGATSHSDDFEGLLPMVTTSSVHQEHEATKRIDWKSKHSTLPQVSENPENLLVYQRFLEEHTCYDLMPTSSKLVVLDTRLEVRKAFHAIIENSLRCAPLWDDGTHSYVGMLTVSDFVNILLTYHKCPNKSMEDLENQKIQCWRKVLNLEKSLTRLPPQASLLDALKVLKKENIRRLAIVDPSTGDVFHVINHRRILHFLHLFMSELPRPSYISKTIGELGIGTTNDVAVVSEDSPVIDALNLIAKHKISGLPVVDEEGRVTDIFTKTDVLVIAEEQLFYDLSIKVRDVIRPPSQTGLNERRPSLVRTMPGSPALRRRRNNPKPYAAKHNMENGGTQNWKKDSASRESEGVTHHAMGCVAHEPHDLGQGDSSLSVYNHALHHDRKISSESSGGSARLVTLKQHDILEVAINNIVNADVLQAVIVDENERMKGVISVGDILRFMVCPTQLDSGSSKRDDKSHAISRVPGSNHSSKSPLLEINNAGQSLADQKCLDYRLPVTSSGGWSPVADASHLQGTMLASEKHSQRVRTPPTAVGAPYNEELGRELLFAKNECAKIPLSWQ